jgi:hypothetical protein
MALIFNLDQTIKAAHATGNTLRAVLDFCINKPIVKNAKSRFIRVNPKAVLEGYSFIINHKDLFADKTTDSAFIDQYIILAGKRDYHLYKMYNYTKLPLSYFPDLNKDSIKYNPLLKVEQDDIAFRYEP